jgi:alpha-1,2-mannosyltransferase
MRQTTSPFERRLRQAILLIVCAAIGASLISAASALAAWISGPGHLISPLYYSSVQAAYRALTLSGYDSWRPMLAAAHWLDANRGGDVYAEIVFNQRIKFQYPATALLPLILLPADNDRATAILNVASLAFLAATIAGMAFFSLALATKAKLLHPANEVRMKRLVVAVAVLASMTFYPLLRGAALGQVQVLLDALFVFACLSYLHGRHMLSGALIALSALIKPQFAALLVLGFLVGDRRLAGFGLGVICIGLGASIALYGFEWLPSYIRLLSHIGSHGESYFANQSLNGLANRLLLDNGNLTWNDRTYAPAILAVQILTAANGAIFLAAGLLQQANGPSSLHRLSAYLVAAICVTVASPVAWEHHYGILLPCFAYAFICLAMQEKRSGSAATASWLLLAVSFAIAGNVLSATNWLADTPWNVLQSYTYFAALLLLAMLVRLKWTSVSHS